MRVARRQRVRRSRGRAAAVAIASVVALLVGTSGEGAAQSSDPFSVTVVQTSADLTQRLTPVPSLEFGSGPAPNEPVITVNSAIHYQTVRGFGAAMTDTSAWLLERGLATPARQALMSQLFTPSGIHLDFVKVPMGASDFTHNGLPYSYDDLPPGKSDPTLRHFSIAHDRAYILPALLQARALNPATEFLATPWSPPAWMKTNHSLSNAHDRGRLLQADYDAWADYFVKFIQAYRSAGIPITAVTVQNEPGVPTLYPGLNFSSAAETWWLAKALAPALARAKLHPKVYGADLGWGPTTAYASASARGAGVLGGLAWHCYFGSPGVMSLFHASDPGLDQIVDECSPGITPTPIPEIIISSLRNWASTVALWNLTLDPTGGPAEPPNHGCEGCQGLATINPQTGVATINPSYYSVGQASAFIARGAQRIATPTFVHYAYQRPGVNVVTAGLDDVAVRNPDGSIVLLTYDNSSAPITFGVSWEGHTFSYELPAGATATFIWNRR